MYMYARGSYAQFSVATVAKIESFLDYRYGPYGALEKDRGKPGAD